MTPADLPSSPEAFQAALASGDFAPRAPPLPVTWNRFARAGGASPRSRGPGTGRTRIEAAVERRAVLARDFVRLRQLQGGYRSRPAANTWEISG